MIPNNQPKDPRRKRKQYVVEPTCYWTIKKIWTNNLSEITSKLKNHLKELEHWPLSPTWNLFDCVDPIGPRVFFWYEQQTIRSSNTSRLRRRFPRTKARRPQYFHVKWLKHSSNELGLCISYIYIYSIPSLCGLQIEFKVMVNSDYVPGN